MNIYEKLQQARLILQNTELKKSGLNKFAGFNYYELKDFIPEVNKIFLDMKLFSKVTFDNEFVIHDIKVIEGQAGLFIAMPSRKTPDGEFKDIAHPINTEAREKIQTAILEAYEKAVSEEVVEG